MKSQFDLSPLRLCPGDWYFNTSTNEERKHAIAVVSKVSLSDEEMTWYVKMWQKLLHNPQNH